MSLFARSFVQTLRAVVSDRYAVVTMLGAVLLYSFFYPAAYRHQVASDLPLVVVDQDHSQASRQLLRKVDAIQAGRVAARVPSLDEALALMAAGRAEAILQVPQGFERDLQRGTQARLVLLGDGAYLSRASTVLGGLGEAITAFGRQAAVGQAAFTGSPASPPVQLVQRPMFNTREGYGSAIVPGVAELIVYQTLLIGIGSLLGGRRRELGRRLHFALPALAGMVLGFCVVGLFGVLYYAGFGFWVQDYPRGGNLVGLLLAAPLFVLATVLCGMAIGSVFDTRERAFQYITATSIPLFFLSGISWPAAMMPRAVVALAHAFPVVPGMNALVRLNQMGARLDEVLPELLNLAVLVVVYGAIVLWRFRAAPAVRQGAQY